MCSNNININDFIDKKYLNEYINKNICKNCYSV